VNAPADPRPNFAAAFAQAIAVTEQVRPEDLDRPTPCAEFDVRTLLGHLLGLAGRIDHIGRGGHFAEAPAVIEDFDPATVPAELARRRDAAVHTWSDDTLLTRSFPVPWGEAPGFGVIGVYVQELTVHSWDLAEAIGASGLDPALAEACLPVAQMVLPPEPRGGEVPFGPGVAVAEDADPYERLAGWLGRRPLVTT
jgi:uncharacterized protein (TIGR03086 family)